MKFMLLIHTDPSLIQGEAGQALIPELLAKHGKLAEALRAAGVDWSGARLQPASTARTVRTDGDAQSLHDGPFAESKEELGGYYMVDAPDIEAALAWAKMIPMPGRGAVEVRPVQPM